MPADSLTVTAKLGALHLLQYGMSNVLLEASEIMGLLGRGGVALLRGVLVIFLGWCVQLLLLRLILKLVAQAARRRIVSQGGTTS